MPDLREAIAAHYTERGLPTSADEVLVTSGAQQALALIVALLVGRGEGVVVDDVSYPNLLDLVTLDGARHAPDHAGRRRARARLGCGTRPRPRVRGWPTSCRRTTTRSAPSSPTAAARPWRGSRATRACTLIDDETIAELPITGAVPRAAGGLRAATRRSSPSARCPSWSGAACASAGCGPTPTPSRASRASARSPTSARSLRPRPRPARCSTPGSSTASRPAARQLDASSSPSPRGSARRLPDWTWRTPRGGPSLWVRLPRPGANAFAQLAARHGVLVLPESALESRPGADQHLRIVFAREPETVEPAVDAAGRAWAAFRRSPERRAASWRWRVRRHARASTTAGGRAGRSPGAAYCDRSPSSARTGTRGRRPHARCSTGGSPCGRSSRDPAKVADLAAAGAEVVVADLADEGALPPPSPTAAPMFLALPLLFDLRGEVALGRSAVDRGADRRRAVPRLQRRPRRRRAATSASSFIDAKRPIIAAARGSGVPTLVIRPTMFMENLLFEREAIEGGELPAPVPAEAAHELHRRAGRRAGPVAAALLRPDLAGEEFGIQGPEALTATSGRRR